MNLLIKILFLSQKFILFVYVTITTLFCALVIYFTYLFVSSFNDIEISSNKKADNSIMETTKKYETSKVYEKSFKENYLKRCNQSHSLNYCKGLYKSYLEMK
jgi:predicted membrane protein